MQPLMEHVQQRRSTVFLSLQVHRFVKSLKQQADIPDVDFMALPQKKRGRLKLLPEEIEWWEKENGVE